ncbi:MAG TPA: acyloxyacyl hydrolase [Thermoanaerobaculia bacterium]|jgi:hypothetical protein
MKRLLFLLLLSPLAFAQNQWNLSVTGGHASMSWHGEADLRALNIELVRPLSPSTQIVFALSPTSIEQPRSWFGDQYGDGSESVHALGGSILLRRRFGRVFYVEGGTGPMYAQKAVPASTSRFNFVSQGGAGVMLSRFMIGYRFQHISNGGYSPRNPGMNVSSVVFGVRVR